ncbi:hypothetical protein [Bradyrhizobium sp. CCBAU 53421]|uniref:hypothetical protein n=1 Tax=Bradyrhizobium sp. CCBAU 53421 TaxID=1325120 RepID=UPI00188AFC38|nr:hypothetical protein [Bradyrhizobium sp. CCBAU 53421]
MEGPTCRVLSIDDPLVEDFPVIRPYIEAGNRGGIPVKACTYPFLRAQGDAAAQRQYGWVVLADPPPAVLDSWIGVACKNGAPKQVDDCAEALANYVESQSGGQFPVTGFVAEGPDGGLCVQNGRPVELRGLIAFEDGVTIQRAANPTIEDDKVGVRTGIYCATDGWGEAVQKQITKNHAIVHAFKKARLAGLDRSCGESFLKAIREKDVEHPWLMASRLNHLAAMTTGVNAMLVKQAERFASGQDLEGECQ